MRKLIFLLPLILLFLNQREYSVFIEKLAPAYAVIDTISPVFAGRLSVSNATQATARNSTAAATLDSASTYNIGVYYLSPNWVINRGFFGFDLPDMSSINSISLELNGSSDRTLYQDTLWNIYSASQAASGGLTTADLDQFDGWQASGAYNGNKLITDWNTTSFSLNWMSFVFNAAGEDTAFVYKNSTFWFMLGELRDYYDVWDTGVAGQDSCYIVVEGSDSNPARLIIDYNEPTSDTAITGAKGRRDKINRKTGRIW